MIELQTPEEAAQWLRHQMQVNSTGAGSLVAHSIKISPGDAFIAWPGAANDGRLYVEAALQAGAVACIVEREGVENFAFLDPRIATYRNLKKSCGLLAAEFFGYPSRQLRIAAVTGTNGKTTTAWWLAAALNRLGVKTAAIGTLGVGIPGQVMLETGLTTPDPVLLQQQLRRLADLGYAAVALEASSIGLSEHRLDGTAIEIALFTNFTQDHLDYHGSMESYWEAKAALFDWPGLRAAVVNIDDIYGEKLFAQLQHKRLSLWPVSANPSILMDSGLQTLNIIHTANGLQFNVVNNVDGSSHSVSTAIPGNYNVSNLLGVLAALCAMGFSMADAVQASSALPAVPGRVEPLLMPGLPLVVIDYAHTPDALEKVLCALQPVAQKRNGNLICVFGCGGNRDAEKRPLMGAAAEKNANRVVLTSDNPRSEKPLLIINQILHGFISPEIAYIEPDRRLAIAHAIACAAVEDIVLIAGKGHESTQEVQGVKTWFSDRAEAVKAMDIRNALEKAQP